MSTQRQTLGTLGGSRFNILSAANIFDNVSNDVSWLKEVRFNFIFELVNYYNF